MSRRALRFAVRPGAILALGLLACLSLGCRHFCLTPPAADARPKIRAWLGCEECYEGQLDAVVAMGPAAAPLLIATLRDGLSPATRAKLEGQLRERYRARLDWSARHPRTAPSISLVDYLAHHLGNRAALHRARAAIALGRIGSPVALQALRAALDSSPRSDVKWAILHALGEAPGFPGP